MTQSRLTYIFIVVLAVLAILASCAMPVVAQSEERLYLPQVSAPGAQALIAAAHIDSAISYEPDEAIQLWNAGGRTQSLAGWEISTASRRATIPLTSTFSIEPGEGVWCAANGDAFYHSFGMQPACAWGSASDPNVVILDGGLTLTNHGGQIMVRNSHGKTVDVLLYGDAASTAISWTGEPAQAYARGAIGAEGQVWQRKRDPVTGQPVDMDRASDWAGDLADMAWGRRVFYPGWTLAEFAQPVHIAASATVSIAVAPEGLYEPLSEALGSAQHSIDLSLYVLEHPELAQTIAEAAGRGVRVRILLEGSPVGGVTDLQRWCVARIAAAGGEVRYMATVEGAPKGYTPRYRYTHAKYGIVDGWRAFVGSENLTREAAPVPDGKPVGGRRGYCVFTSSTAVADALSALFATDWRPQTFFDLQPYQPTHLVYGDPPAGYAPPPSLEYPVDEAPFAQTMSAHGPANFVVMSAPENALRPDDGLFALLDRAGAGDEVYVAQLYEHTYWGDSTSNAVADPNPRIERIIAAARRGARVRVLLDSLYDEAGNARSNRATATYLQDIAVREQLDIEVRLGNPTGGGLHGKLVLIRVGDKTWTAVGSLNGGEVSHKLNREVMLLTDAPAVYDRLYDVFSYDWGHAAE